MEHETRPLSEILEDALHTRGVSPEKLAQLSGVSERFLNAILTGSTKDLPSAPYVRGYLLKIAEQLGLDGADLWAAYLKPDETIHRAGKNDALPGNRFESSKIKTKTIAVFGIAAIILIYILFRIPSLFGAPSFSITDIEPNMVVRETPFTVHGSMNPKDKLTVNGEVIYPDSKGDFSKTIELHPGFNTIEFRIKRFLGQEQMITKQIFYETTSTPARATSTPQNGTQENL